MDMETSMDPQPHTATGHALREGARGATIAVRKQQLKTTVQSPLEYLPR